MIPLPMPPKIISQEGNQAVFEIKELYPGYGTTISNSLRRVLLSSLPGAAITKMKIEDVPHEFTTISGVKEDVILIMLNLKKIRFRVHDDESHKIYLKAKGEKEITAGDFETPPQLTIVNPDQHIASLTEKKASLDLKATVEQGVGYKPAPTEEVEQNEIGEILVDAVFSPVKRVTFSVEDMIVGKRTDFNRLLLTIETDGTITPKRAFVQAAEILEEHFSSLVGAFTVEPREKHGQALSKSITELDLSTRTQNVLQEAGIETISDLLERSEEEVSNIEGIGKKSFQDIKDQIDSFGFSLKS